MSTRLDQEFVKATRKNHQDAISAQQNSRLAFETLVNEVNRLEAYCAELEAKLAPDQIQDASAKGFDEVVKNEGSMTKDFEARAKQREAFETEWEFQQGSLMLKNVNEGKEWKRVVADWFFQQGARYGREAGLEMAAEIAESEESEYIKSMEAMDKAGDIERGNKECACAVTAKYIAEDIREAKGKKGTNE